MKIRLARFALACLMLLLCIGCSTQIAAIEPADTDLPDATDAPAADALAPSPAESNSPAPSAPEEDAVADAPTAAPETDALSPSPAAMDAGESEMRYVLREGEYFGETYALALLGMQEAVPDLVQDLLPGEHLYVGQPFSFEGSFLYEICNENGVAGVSVLHQPEEGNVSIFSSAVDEQALSRAYSGSIALASMFLPADRSWWDIEDLVLEMMEEVIEAGYAIRTEYGVRLDMAILPSEDGGERKYMFAATLVD